MKPAATENRIASDRLATWNEFLSAVSFASNGACELRCTSDGYYEMESDVHGWVRILKEDLEAWASAGEILKTMEN